MGFGPPFFLWTRRRYEEVSNIVDYPTGLVISSWANRTRLEALVAIHVLVVLVVWCILGWAWMTSLVLGPAMMLECIMAVVTTDEAFMALLCYLPALGCASAWCLLWSLCRVLEGDPVPWWYWGVCGCAWLPVVFVPGITMSLLLAWFLTGAWLVATARKCS